MPSTRRRFLTGIVAAAALTGSAAADTDAEPDAPTETWSRTYTPGNTDASLVRDIVPLNRGVAPVGVAGELDGYRGWVAGVHPDGRARWHRRLGAESSAFRGGALDGGGLLAAGVTNATEPAAGDSHADPYVCRVDADGDAEWRRTYQPEFPDGKATAVVRTDAGHVVAGVADDDGGTGRPWAVGLDDHGTARWTWLDEGDRAGDVNAATAVDGGVVVAGSTWPVDDDPGPHGRREGAWAAKLTPEGGTAWRWSVDRENGDRVEALAPGPDGGAVALGRRGFATRDRGVGWLVALDADGAKRWERTYSQQGWNWHHDIAPVGDGYALVGTREDGPDTDDREAWVLRVDADGRERWNYQGPTGSRGFAVQALDDGGLLVGGAKEVESADGRMAWLAKLGGSSTPGGSVDGVELPAPPGWLDSFVAGGVVGALGVAGLRRLRSED